MERKSTLSKKIMASTSPVVFKRIETRMLVAKILHDYLSTWKISQQELACRMGKQPSEVSKWLSGNHNFTIDTLSDIGYYLNTDFIIRRDEMVSFRCVHVLQIDNPSVKTCNFRTLGLNAITTTNRYVQNNKRLEKCLA